MAQRRGHGEDAVYKDGDRWRASIELGRGPDGIRRRKKVSGRTKAEVLAELRRVKSHLETGLPAPDDRLTVSAFLARWGVRDVLPGQVGDATLDNYAIMVDRHLAPAVGHKVLSRLRVADVDEVWAKKRADGYSANSVRIMRAVLRRALGQAEREGLVARNVAALSVAPRVSQPEGRSLTVEQVQALLQTASTHRLGPLIVLLLAFGLRRGEGLGLRWRDLDWRQGTLAVTQAVKRVNVREADAGRKSRIIVGEVKTRRSRRTLYLTPELLAALRKHQAAQAEERLLLGAAWEDHGLIFPSEVGTPLDPANFRHILARLCQRAGLGHWHPHELRHSGASLMLAHGTPLHVVSEVLGHASIAITKDVYGHLMEGDKRAASAVMSGVLWGLGDTAAERK